MADDVLDDDDRVVHQDADREDEREERDPVEGVAVEVEDEQRERERRRDGEEHDRRLAPAEEQQDEQGHPEHGDAHVQEQFVALLGGRVSVVARDRHADLGRDDPSAEGLEAGARLPDDFDGVGARTLGEGERDRGFERALLVGMEDVVARVVGLRAHRRHVAEAHGLSAFEPDDEVAEILFPREGPADLEVDLFAAEGAGAELTRLIGLLDRADDLRRRHAVGREPLRIEPDAHRQAAPADDRRLRGGGKGLEGFLRLRRDTTQLQMAEFRAMERDREDGDVVDRPGAHGGRGGPGRQDVAAGRELGVDPAHGHVGRGADLEACDQQDATRA